MVRGTNKMIIEINETGNPYFERAVLYVKEHPQGKGREKKKMEEEAQSYIATIQKEAKPKFAFLRGGSALKMAAAAAAGGLVSFLAALLLLWQNGEKAGGVWPPAATIFVNFV